MKNREAIAIIGMSIRLPGAADIGQFWQNLSQGVEAVQKFDKDSLLKEGYIPPDLLNHPHYLPIKGYLKDADCFAADFFKLNANQANILDPQCRLLMECVWEAWEDAGYNISNYLGVTGVFMTSSSQDSYYNNNLLQNTEYNLPSRQYELLIANAKDFLATRIAYQFNFTGPCVNIQTACSSSLVALSHACDALLENKCDMAVVGGMSITFPLKNGYLYKEGMIFSKDGHCRAFGQDASGIVPGNGGGVVLLKKLSQAIADKDHIYAAIKGYAINNDGRDKLSYTAPSIHGQCEVLQKAANAAGIKAEDLDYIEAHGTGTNLGDQIEVESLKRFLKKAKKPVYLGSVKSNIGHLDVAAGLVSLIKTTLGLYNKIIPKTLHATPPNPELALGESILRLAEETLDWPVYNNKPKMAGVSSFGVGGTNAHVILEEVSNYNDFANHDEDGDWYLLPISATSEEELESKKDQLAVYIHDNSPRLRDVAYVLQVGRQHFSNRLAVICNSSKEAVDLLYLPSAESMQNYFNEKDENNIVLLLSNEVPNIEEVFVLYTSLKLFQTKMDELIDIILKLYQIDLRVYFLKSPERNEIDRLHSELILFITLYSLTSCILELGVKPKFIIGYANSQLVSSCLAGQTSIESAIQSIIKFSQQKIKEIVYLEVLLEEEKLIKAIDMLPIKIVSINSPRNFTVQLSADIIESFKRKLDDAAAVYKITNNYRLFQDSEINGNSFLANIKKTLKPKSGHLFLTVGAGDQLCRWVQQISNKEAIKNVKVLPGVFNREVSTKKNTQYYVNEQIAWLWLFGVLINWNKWQQIWGHLQHSRRIRLPTYPFSRKKYLVEPHCNLLQSNIQTDNKLDIQHLYCKSWKELPIQNSWVSSEHDGYIFHSDNSFMASKIFSAIQECNANCSLMNFISSSEKVDDDWLVERTREWEGVLKAASKHNKLKIIIAYSEHQHAIKIFYQLMALSRAIAKYDGFSKLNIIVLSHELLKIFPSDKINPENSYVLGPILCLPYEHKKIKTKYIDINYNELSDSTECMLSQIQSDDTNSIVAIRKGRAYIQEFLPISSQISQILPPIKLRKNGVYIITGGLRGVGLVMAQYLAEQYEANLILLSKTVPPRWENLQGLAFDSALSYDAVARMQAIEKIQKDANQILLYEVDVSDYEKMNDIIKQVIERFGRVNGVIHAASNVPAGLLSSRTVDDTKSMFGSKIVGVKNLKNIFNEINLDFMILCSALNSYTGAAGAADYVSANTFLDNYALAVNAQWPIIAISWDAWYQTGMYNRHQLISDYDRWHAYILGYSKWKPLVIEHTLDGKMVILGALLLELGMQTVFGRNNKSFPICIRDVSFIKPGIVEDLENYKLAVKYNNSNNEVEFKSENINNDNIFRATIKEGSQDNREKIDLQALLLSFEQGVSPENEIIIGKKARRISLGPHWDCLIWVKKLSNKYLAKIKLPETFIHELDGSILHPSLFDVAYSYHAQFMQQLYLPFYIDCINIHKTLPAEFFSLVEIRSINAETGICNYDVMLIDNQGEIILSIESMSLKVFEASATSLEREAMSSEKLSNEEGIAALNAVLSNPFPQVLVTKDKDIKNTGQFKKKIKDSNHTVDLESENVNIVEQIKRIWQSVLGSGVIRPDDDFFDLNGDSLSAIEVCYLIKLKTGKNVAPNVLIEQPIFSNFIDKIFGNEGGIL